MFLEGDLVRWYEMYMDIMIVRNTGLGVILSKFEHKCESWSQVVYKVYRPTTQDTITIEECYIEKI